MARRHRAVLAWMLGARAALTADPGPPKGGMRPQTPHSSTSFVAMPTASGSSPAIGRRRPATAHRRRAAPRARCPGARRRRPALVDPVRALLAPHADMTCGIGYRTFAGVAAFHLGRLAAVTGDWADAERHMLAALRRFSAPGSPVGRSRSAWRPTWSRRGAAVRP